MEIVCCNEYSPLAYISNKRWLSVVNPKKYNPSRLFTCVSLRHRHPSSKYVLYIATRIFLKMLWWVLPKYPNVFQLIVLLDEVEWIPWTSKNPSFSIIGAALKLLGYLDRTPGRLGWWGFASGWPAIRCLDSWRWPSRWRWGMPCWFNHLWGQENDYSLKEYLWYARQSADDEQPGFIGPRRHCYW